MKTINKDEIRNLIQEWKRDNSESKGFTQYLVINYDTLKIDNNDVEVEFSDMNMNLPEDDEGRLNFKLENEEIEFLSCDIF